MINCRGDFKAVGCVLKDSWQRKNQGNSHTLRNFRRACEIHGSFHMGCENFAHPTNQFHTLCENKLTLRTPFAYPTPCETLYKNLRDLRTHFAPPTPFCTLCKNQKTLCENQKTLCHLFLNPRVLIFPFRKHPYHCESLIFLCHFATSSLHSVTSSFSIRNPTTRISLQRVALRAPFEH